MLKTTIIMKNKILLFLLMIASSQIWGQTETITITQTSAGVTQSSYDNGTERTWTQDEVDFGAKAVLKQGDQARIQVQAEDRKSTRLNSSHVKISYAV